MRRFAVLLVACSGPDGPSAHDPWSGGDDDSPDATATIPEPVDADGDGVTAPSDCDDTDPGRFPDAPEQCDGLDQDCDGLVDDGIPTDGAGCFDPGPPVDDGLVDTVTVTVRTGSGTNQGTNDANPTLCLGEGLCYVLGLADWNDREVGAIEVHSFEVGGLPRAGFDRFELTATDGSDAWVPTGFEVALDGALVHCEDAPGVTIGNAATETLAWTDPAGLHVDCATVYPTGVTHGPIVSPGQSDDEIHLWLRTSSTRRVAVVVAETSEALATAAPVAFGYPLASADYTLEVQLRGITADRTWFYAIDVDGTRLGPWTFTAPPLAGVPGVRRLAFGSCSKFDDQPSFGAILAYDPDLFLFLGDNHYGNTSDLQSLRQYYRWSHERLGRATLLANTPVIATWDDHDFVGNNTLGIEEPGRDVSLRGFDEYWANPSLGAPGVPGVFSRTSWGDIDWFLVDDRYHRGEDDTMLGLAQETWLIDALASSTATFKLVACGSEWSYTGTTDSWDEFRAQRERIFQALVDRYIPGVVLLSGDIHRSEFRRLTGAVGGYDLPEIISSPLANVNSNCPTAVNPELIACFNAGPSFVTLDVDTTLADPSLTASIHDEAGSIVSTWSILRSELEPRDKIAQLEVPRVKPFVVLCMAGHYRRFRDAGYPLPKYLLPARGRRVLEQVIDGLQPDRLLLVANFEDLAHEPTIRSCIPQDAEILWVGPTSGQAETAAFGARRLRARGIDGPVLFHNVDTIVRGRDLEAIGDLLQRVDGFVDTFPSDSPAFSYVAVEDREVTAIAEKVVISAHATTGLYGFRSAESYRTTAAATTVRSREFYISDVYRKMLDDGARIEILPPGPDHETIVLGTPAEYEAWLAARS